MIAGCNIDTLAKGVMMLDTLSGHDFAGDGFDMCAVDDFLQHIEPTWEAGKGVFAIEFTVGYGVEMPEELGIPTEQFGFLGQISAITGKDYTNYDVFRADIAQHADERTLNDLDVFLRWLWEEVFVSQVLNEAELNVYVGLAFETHAEGMNVYLYYGHCDGMAMEVGLNQMVYRSVEDIVGPQQVHAPTVSLFGVGVGWVYGLDEDCSLKSMGTNLGKGESDFVDINWEHIFDEDGHQCETVQVIPLNGQSLPAKKTRRVYTVYENQQCEGTGTDILRDFEGTASECKAKCDELECIGFVRVNSTGKCYFRGGDVERPYEYSSDDRDCYIPDGYSMRSRLLNM